MVSRFSIKNAWEFCRSLPCPLTDIRHKMRLPRKALSTELSFHVRFIGIWIKKTVLTHTEGLLSDIFYTLNTIACSRYIGMYDMSCGIALCLLYTVYQTVYRDLGMYHSSNTML